MNILRKIINTIFFRKKVIDDSIDYAEVKEGLNELGRNREDLEIKIEVKEENIDISLKNSPFGIKGMLKTTFYPITPKCQHQVYASKNVEKHYFDLKSANKYVTLSYKIKR